MELGGPRLLWLAASMLSQAAGTRTLLADVERVLDLAVGQLEDPPVNALDDRAARQLIARACKYLENYVLAVCAAPVGSLGEWLDGRRTQAVAWAMRAASEHWLRAEDGGAIANLAGAMGSLPAVTRPAEAG